MKKYDVLILGSGLGGSITASILAKRGWSVLLIDAASHPRFAIGEATTPDISFMLKIIAAKYDVPELQNLTTFHELRDNVSSKCGTKKSFSFLYHREGEDQNPKESHQFPTLAPPLGPDCHLFRQDTDTYVMGVALDYGADIRQRTKIEKFDFDDDGVVLTSDSGEEFHGRYLIDGSGFRSPMATEQDLRDASCRLKTKSRALFTHMIGVELYDDIANDSRDYGLDYRFAEGTLHHVFDGGWMWVIPFNNHPDSTNAACSVGVLFDVDKYPPTDLTPEEEFASIIKRFPKVAEQMRNAKPVRDWVRTGRVQYSSKAIQGDRFCLLAHAAGFVDPLFSTGLNLTLQLIDQLIAPLDEALKEDDFCTSRFKPVEESFQENLEYCDRVVANAFTSFDDYDLWDAWFRVWVAANYVATSLSGNIYLNFDESQDKAWLDKTSQKPYAGALASNFKQHRELFEAADAQLQAYRDGQIEASQAADAIRGMFETAKYLPKFCRWHDKNVRSTGTFTLPDLVKIYCWYAMFAPKDVRKYVFTFSASCLFKYTWKKVRKHRSRAKSRRRYVRDAIFAS